MKTREQAEQRALELFPDISDEDVAIESFLNHISSLNRKAYLKGWEEAQDTKLREDKIDLISLSSKHLDKMNKELSKTGLVPKWWMGLATISITAIKEYESASQDTKLREAAQFATDAIAHFLVENRDYKGQLEDTLYKLEKALK
jgi:hypothetical protein